jgi:alpha-tubulin suppressor-like RCC1 family protein
VELALGDDFACARVQDGSIYCWGRNAEGECGDLSAVDKLTPTPVALPSKAKALFTGHRNACAFGVDGQTYCWGDASYGQLGPDASGYSLPKAFTALRGLTQMSLGDDQSCAIDADSHVWCWGRNQYGQLGDGTLLDRAVPRFVAF